MSEEVKAKVDDMKDYAQQVKLEANIKGREMKTKALKGVVDATGHELTTSDKVEGAKMVGTDLLHSAEDKLKQGELEAKIQGRDAKVAVDKTDTKKALDAAAIKTKDALVDAKDAIVDALPQQTKTVETTSARGIDITHIEGDNDRLLQREKKMEYREKRDEEIEKEKKREQLVADAKVKAAAVKASATKVLDKAEVVLGNAALSLKEKLDNYTDDTPAPKAVEKTSASGVDISSVQNPRNEELSKRDERAAELAKGTEPTFMEKTKETLTKAVETITAKVNDVAATEPPAVYVPKTSAKGIDISHVENAANPQLALKEEEALRLEKDKNLQVEKARIEAHVIEPADQTFKSKMSALGESISKAAHKLGDSVKNKYQDMQHPPEVHEKTSESGIDTTSIQNPRNEEIGQEIKAKNNPTAASASTTAVDEPIDIHANESLKEKAIRHTLDAGVAMREAGQKVGAKAAETKLAAGQKTEEVEFKAEVKKEQIKQDAVEAKVQVNQKAHELADKTKATLHDTNVKTQAMAHRTSEKTKELTHDVTEKTKELAHDVSEKTKELAHDVSVKTEQLAHDASSKMHSVTHSHESAPTIYSTTKAELATKTGTADDLTESERTQAMADDVVLKSKSGAFAKDANQRMMNEELSDRIVGESYEKPSLPRAPTLPIVATASPITPDTFATFSARPVTQVDPLLPRP